VRRTDGRTNITKTSRHTYRQITRRCAGGMRRCSERMQSGGSIPGTCLSPARRRGDWLTCAAYFICLWCGRNLMNRVAPFAPSRFLVAITNCDVWTPLLCPRPVGGALRGHRRPSSVRPSVCLSDVVYIGSNSKTKRPMKTKLCTGVPQVTCDSHTDFKVKRSKVKVSRGGSILWRPPSRTACWNTVCPKNKTRVILNIFRQL